MATSEARMTDFRLLRHGGFYHAVARYGEDLWTTFTYAGLHASERVLRRKEQHRFWGVDCYSSGEDRYFRIGNRTFYENPDQEVEPSGLGGGGRGRLGQGVGTEYALSGNTPTIFCTPGRQLYPGGGAAALPGPGVRPLGPSRQWAGPRRPHCGCGGTPTWRPSTAAWPTACS